MTPENRRVEQWATERGLRMPFAGAVSLSCQGQDLSVGYLPGGGIAVTAVLEDRSPKKAAIRGIAKDLRRYGKVLYNPSKGYLHFFYAAGKTHDFTALTDYAVAAIAAALISQGLSTRHSCVFCGAELTNAGVELDQGVIVPVHASCKQNHMPIQTVTTPEEIVQNHYLLGTLGALIGVLIGLLPGVLTLIWILDRYYPFLFLLAAPCALLGYRIFRGKPGVYTGFLVMVLALVGTLKGHVLSRFFISDEFHSQRLAGLFLFAREYFAGPFQTALPELLMLLLYAGIGMILTWFLIGMLCLRRNRIPKIPVQAELSSVSQIPAIPEAMSDKETKTEESLPEPMGNDPGSV